MKPTMLLLKRPQINEEKWNDVIENATAGFPYAYTWYLDAVAPNWDAIVYGDYEIVFPIPISNKFGINYVYQPLFCQQLGAFSKCEIKNSRLEKMIELITKKYLFVNLNLNTANSFDKTKKIATKKNLVIPLYNSYEIIKKRYSDNLLRNIKRADRKGLIIEEGMDDFVDFYIKNTAVLDTNFKSQHTQQLTNLVEKLIQHKMARIFSVKNKEQKICAATLLVETQNRIINLLPATNEKGRENGAMHFLIDKLLQSNQSKKKLFDFEGSSILSIARFYKSFGAQEESFGCINKRIFVFKSVA